MCVIVVRSCNCLETSVQTHFLHKKILKESSDGHFRGFSKNKFQTSVENSGVFLRYDMFFYKK